MLIVVKGLERDINDLRWRINNHLFKAREINGLDYPCFGPKRLTFAEETDRLSERLSKVEQKLNQKGEQDQLSEKENDPDTLGNKNETPLAQVSPADMGALLNDAIKNKKIYVNWDYIISDGDRVVVWLGHTEETDDEISDGLAKYMIDPSTEKVWLIDHDNTLNADKPKLKLIGKGLGAIINIENSTK